MPTVEQLKGDYPTYLTWEQKVKEAEADRRVVGCVKLILFLFLLLDVVGVMLSTVEIWHGVVAFIGLAVLLNAIKKPSPGIPPQER